MKKNRKYVPSKGTTAHYNSLEELRADYGFKPVTNRTADENKLEKQKEQFVGKCKVCGQPMSFIPGTNVLACKNENCKGIKIKKGEQEFYIPVSRVLDEKGADIGNTLFA